VTERLAAHGLHAMVASEPEFYVLRVGEDGAIEHYSPLAGMAYTTGVRADPSGVVRRMHSHLDTFGLGVTTALREFSPGQFEINLAHADAGRIQNWPRYLGGDEDNVTINPQRGTGATVRESLDATINKLRRGFHGSDRRTQGSHREA
jgi:hypothetical protein